MPALFCVTLFNCVTSNWRSGLRPATLRPALLLYGILRRALAVGALVLPALHGAQAQSGYTVSAEQLQQVLAQRFPLRYPVAGLLDLDIQARHECDAKTCQSSFDQHGVKIKARTDG